MEARFRHPRRLHTLARDRRKTRLLPLVDIRWELGRANVHPVDEVLRYNVDDELARLLDVAEGILLLPVAAAYHWSEAHHRRICADSREKAERRQIPDTAQADGRDEGDRPRHNRPNHQLVNIRRPCFGRIDRHSASLT